MTHAIRPILRRLGFLKVASFWDRLRVLRERSSVGLRQLLSRCIDVEAWQPARRRRKKTYLPEVTALELRQMPTISVTASGFAATAAVQTSGTVGSFSDPGGTYPLGAYTILVDWGDGTAESGGTIILSNEILANHVYAKAGTYTYRGSAATKEDTGVMLTMAA